MRIAGVLIIAMFLVAPASAAKKLKPKYYKQCYADYKELRALVPKPSMDVEKTAKTISTVAGIAGRFGGFGGLGSAAATASTVAQYSQTIADVAAFTQNMTESFPKAADRYHAYGERMGSEAGEMERVADFATRSQECYGQAYAELKTGAESGDIKAKDVKKRHKEITVGVANVSEMLEHAAIYMDTNIDAYNQALTQETTGAGLDLGKLASLAGQATAVGTQVKELSGPGTGWLNSGWTPTQVRIEAHRQAMAARYGAAGYSIPAGSVAGTAQLFDSLGSLTQMANLADSQPQSDDDRVAALADAGEEVQPYLTSFGRIKALAEMQKGFSGFVSRRP